MNVLEVEGLIKQYPKFTLGPLSFRVEAGSITGFIGRNGAGKTTTLKSILNIAHPTAGTIRYFGASLAGNERAVKQRIGFAGGAVDWYPRRRVSEIAAVTRRFYDNWDDGLFEKYMDAFSIDPEKAPRELSEGMRVKLNLVFSLSHRAELLILDEPTSGLDPVSRAELLDIFRVLRDQGTAILFSTHITSDLDKCADHIVYIRGGRLVAARPLPAFVEEHRAQGLGGDLEEIMLGYEKEDFDEKLAL